MVDGYLDVGTYIINGQETRVNAFPWQLAIEEDDGSSWSLTCGGVIIDASWAITAAQCVSDKT